MKKMNKPVARVSGGPPRTCVRACSQLTGVCVCVCVRDQKPQKAPSDEDEDDSNGPSPLKAPNRDRPGRAKKEVKYFDESDNEDDGDDDMFD